jgi:hypothetical protein
LPHIGHAWLVEAGDYGAGADDGALRACGHGGRQGGDEEGRDLDVDGNGLVGIGLSSARGQVTDRRCAVQCGQVAGDNEDHEFYGYRDEI